VAQFVEALRFKPEGGTMALGLTACNRNEYQEYFLGGKGGRCIGGDNHNVPTVLKYGSLNVLEPSGACPHL